MLRYDVVRAAVARALDAHRRHAATSELTIDAVVDAVAQAQGARISVRDAVLPFGAFGRWVRYPDGQEVFEVAVGLAARDWTVAHELGHLMLRHDHQGRGGCASAHRRAERDAERFASLITSRIEAARRAPRESIFL